MGFSELSLVPLIEFWNSSLSLTYQEFRDRLQQTSLSNYRSVNNSHCLSAEEFRGLTPDADDLVVFVDDDDWLSPDLFGRLQSGLDNSDGAIWGSVRIGIDFGSPPGARPEDVFQLRPIDRLIYTNNYAVTGRALHRLGYDALFEHGAAQAEFDGGSFQPVTVPEYLSVANKHPCCLMAAGPLLGSPLFITDPRAVLAQFAGALEAVEPPPGLEWITTPLQALISLVKAAAS
jgi:hypothetical protein